MTPTAITVLLVDDDDAIRLVIRSMLELNDYRVIDASTPTKALTLFDKNPAALSTIRR